MNLLNDTQYKWSHFLLYFFSFLLFWEWLRPLEIITDTGDISRFVVFAAFAFLVSFLQMNMWVGAGLKAFFMFYSLHSLFFSDPFLRFSWVKVLSSDITYNVGLLLDARWWEMTNLFRSFLFFILLWLMSYLMYYWVVQVKRVFIFIVFTMVYITVLDTFTAYDATNAVVRTVILGFFLLGALSFTRLKETESVTFPNPAKMLFWIFPLLTVLVLSIVLGYSAPKAAPQWADPVPYLKSAARGAGGGPGEGGIQKVGYDSNDSRLGGPFIGDDSPVFTAEVNEVHYWRVETKDVYTGKGWEVSSEPPAVTKQNDAINLRAYENTVEKEPLEATIQMAEGRGYPHIVYPLELKSVETDEPVEIQVNPFTEKVTTRRNGEPEVLDSYSLTYDYPKFSMKALKENSGQDPPEIKETFTQLPEDMPERVKELAQEIVADEEGRYDRAKAIEQYFSSSGFVYETTDVAVPEEDEDYVDQFLFETKKGYCDNYSTSMIALLRAVDIPARWVKGYTQGEYEETLEPSVRRYEVQNKNAHSWVEVYFPNVGWVPFEPTRGFRNPYDFRNDTTETPENDATEQTDQEKPEQEKPEDDKNQAGGKGFSFHLDFTPLQIAIISIVFLLVAFVLFKTRNKWLTWLTITRYKYRSDEDTYFDAYAKLLKRLDQFGLKREEGQTLREYAHYVDHHFGTSTMRALTSRYERVLYRREDANAEWKQSMELWENLIKRLTS